MILIVVLVVPLLSAALMYLPLGRRWLGGATIVGCVTDLALTGWIAVEVSEGHPIIGPGHATLSKWIFADGLGALILLLIALVGTLAAIFSIGYLKHESLSVHKRRLYFLNFNLFLFSMLAIPVLAEPTLAWIMVELTTVCSVLLVSFNNTREALEAAWKYVVLSLMGAGVALFGFLLLFAALQASGTDGSYTWSGLAAAAPRMPSVLLNSAFALILVGLGTKTGLVPMHTWLPDAHSQAPAPVCALLSGVETTAILCVILRFFPIMHAAPGSHARAWALAFGLVSVGAAAFLLLQVREYKRLFAFSTVEHMGIILTAVGLGSSAAGYGAMQQILTHAVTKSFCFFAAGTTLLVVGEARIAGVRKLVRTAPATSLALIFGGLAIGGAPPLAVFLSEFSILRAGLALRSYFVTGLLTLFIAVAFFGVMLHLNRMVFGRAESPEGERLVAERSGADVESALPWSCKLVLILSALPVAVLGVYVPEPLHRLLNLAAATLMK